MHVWTIGIDEAGRGPIAGPVAVGVVAVRGNLPAELDLDRDSKKLTPKARDRWFARIKEARALGLLDYACGLVGAEIIDERGIVFAINQAMQEALSQIVHDPNTSCVLLDGGLRAPVRYEQQTSIIKGDEREPIIALASVVAKVTRDRYMEELSKKYPDYGFDKHKGYGTKAHYEAITKTGLCPIHRQTFIKA